MSTLQFFNTLGRARQEFVPLDETGRTVGIYCCGPTIYDFGHIGNFRTFVFADLVRRYLEFRGYPVHQVMNLTDVEDKIIQRVRESGMPLREFTQQFENAFLEDLSRLHCLRPHQLPRATDHIPQIIDLISTLVKKGLAYQANDKSVYFSIAKYQACGGCYGKLLPLNLDELRAGSRVSTDEYDKEALGDFALWKSRANTDGDIFWASPWGDGRPGWHIECSAMSMELLGQSFDVHLGGEDLVFPHHEDEIAQSEGATGRRFVKYWLHASHLLVEGRKMSKSLGNFFTVRDLLAKGHSGREIRFLLLSAHYRDSLNFTMEGLEGARSALARIDEWRNKLEELAQGTPGTPDAQILERFTEAMDADLNVAAAWAVIFDWIRDTNRSLAGGGFTREQAGHCLATWTRVDSVWGMGARIDGEVPPAIQELLEARAAAKKVRDFARADAVRRELHEKGWLVEDTPKGPRLKKR